MDDNFRKKLIEDIDDSGFGSEMRAVRAFQEAGWSTFGAAAYFDRDSNITREIDIKAHHSITGRSRPESVAISTYYALIAEVKKASAPWVAIRTESDHTGFVIDAWNNLIYVDGFPDRKKPAIAKDLSQSSLSKFLGWQAHGMHESFKKPDISSRWYSAFVSSCKAAEDDLDANTFPASNGEIYLYFSKPIVVLDGQLLSAKLAGPSVTVEEIDFAPFQFEFRTVNYTRRSYSVDVVRLSALAKYLELCNRRANAIFDALARAAPSTTEAGSPQTAGRGSKRANQAK